MKVLTYVPKIYEPQLPEYCNDKSGLALYVHDIVLSLAPHMDVDVLTQQVANGGKIGDVTYLSNTKVQVLIQSSLSDYAHALSRFVNTKGSIRNKLKRAFLTLESGRFGRVLAKTKPDVVNIHGCNPEIFRQIDECKQAKVPFVVSLHGLIGLDASVNATDELKDIEKKVFQRGDKEGWPIVAISSGVKNRAVDFYGLKHPENIRVILNGTNFSHEETQNSLAISDWLKQVNPEEKRIILCVGAISKRKNQVMVVEAWNQMPQEIKNTHMVLFLGKDLLNGTVQASIEKYHLQDSMHVCGHQEKDVLNQLYRLAVCNVLASIDEGFGLSLIEAMGYGVPSVTFADLDAVPDIYDEKVIQIVNTRTVANLAIQFEAALRKKWDVDYIKQYSARFTMNQVSLEYQNEYESVLRG